jgi:hypothetical protein
MSECGLTSLPVQRTTDVPFAAYKRGQAALARHRLYPLTVFYTLYAIFALIVAFSTTHPWAAIALFAHRVPLPSLRPAWSLPCRQWRHPEIPP